MAIERDRSKAIPVTIFYLASLAAIWYRYEPTWITFIPTAILLAGGFYLIYMAVSYKKKEGESYLYGLKPIVDKWPAVKRPEGHVKFRTKMLWTLGILIFYFFLANVTIYGLGPSTLDLFSEFRAILAGQSGSLMHLGIGPIVTGSIIMQLFTGAKIINLDLTKSEDKAIYQGVQKILVLVMIFVEAIPQTFGYLTPSDKLVDMVGDGPAKMIIIAQLVYGSYLVFLMDEVVSKWGIGSGISMFIAAGVSQSIVTGSINWIPMGAETASKYNLPADVPSGTIPKTIYFLTHYRTPELAGGGFERIFLSPPNPIVALLTTMLIFFIVAYAESMRVELPLSHARVRGARGRYPIRLIYSSNIPVILMSALLANVNMFTLLLWSNPTLQNIPGIGHSKILGWYEPGATRPSGGLAWYMMRLNGLQSWLLPMLNWERYGGYVGDHQYWELVLHIVVYLSLMVFGSILFAIFWIETTDMGPEAVARQIQSSGMIIPGFRRDPRVLKRVLERYIPQVTIISGAFVGLLAATADMIGTVGDTSGTGVLLTVGILIRLYEEIGKEQMMEMHPVLRGFFGGR